MRAGRVRERQQHRPVQREPPRRRERLLDGRARELVPERDASVDDVEDAAREALVHGVGRLAAHREEELRVERGRSDRRRLDDRRRLGAELRHPGEHEVAHGVGHLVGAVREELGHVERVPGGEAPDDVEVHARGTGELGDPVAGERPDDEPLDGRRGRDVSERDAERVVARRARRRGT